MQWKLQCIYVHSYLGTPWVCTEARVCNEAYPPCLAGWYLIYCYHSCQLVYLPLNSEHCVDRDICADHFLYSIHLKLSYANRHPDRKVAGCFLLSCLYKKKKNCLFFLACLWFDHAHLYLCPCAEGCCYHTHVFNIRHIWSVISCTKTLVSRTKGP